MKKFTFLFITVFSIAVIQAQNITDALRYSTEALNGTARFNALSGAFGALGGDASAMTINPAGSAVFLKSAGSASLSVVDKKNKATYFNTRTNTSDTNLKFNQAGFVFVINNLNLESSFNKFTFGINYISTQNHDEDLFVTGTGNTSIGEFFLAQAQGIPLDLLQLQSGESISSLYAYLGETEGVAAQNAFLGYQGFIIDPIDPDDPTNTMYFSNIAPGTFNQQYSYYTSGYNGISWDKKKKHCRVIWYENKKEKNSIFSVSTFKGEENALNAAIKFRDEIYKEIGNTNGNKID